MSCEKQQCNFSAGKRVSVEECSNEYSESQALIQAIYCGTRGTGRPQQVRRGDGGDRWRGWPRLSGLSVLLQMWHSAWLICCLSHGMTQGHDAALILMPLAISSKWLPLDRRQVMPALIKSGCTANKTLVEFVMSKYRLHASTVNMHMVYFWSFS